MDVKKIMKLYLHANGYDGVCNNESKKQCHCEKFKLKQCLIGSCRPFKFDKDGEICEIE